MLTVSPIRPSRFLHRNEEVSPNHVHSLRISGPCRTRFAGRHSCSFRDSVKSVTTKPLTQRTATHGHQPIAMLPDHFVSSAFQARLPRLCHQHREHPLYQAHEAVILSHWRAVKAAMLMISQDYLPVSRPAIAY